MNSSVEAMWQHIRELYLADEDWLLKRLLPLAATNTDIAREEALHLVESIRRQQSGRPGVDALLAEFSLSTEEGVVLMCLAEALLRVPDALTADRLIIDKLAGGDWAAHTGQGHSLFVNASAWALLFTGRMVSYRDEHRRQLHSTLQRAIARLGQPMVRHCARSAMELMGNQFVMGENIAAAMSRARKQEARGYRYSYDMLGEGARCDADAQRYLQNYRRAIAAIGAAVADVPAPQRPGISVKLSAIHPRYQYSQRERVLKELVPRLTLLSREAHEAGIPLTVDAEEAARLEISLEVIAQVFSDGGLSDWAGFGLAVQAYQKRALAVVDWCHQLAQRVGRRMAVRLVKGAYWDSEIKLAQLQGLTEYPVFTRKAATDVSYQACARRLLECRDWLYPQFATHNAYTVAAILAMDSRRDGYEFQRLHGMGEALYDEVMQRQGVPCRIYAPVGEHSDLLAYLVRRLLENGANSSFVNNIVDESIPVENLVSDPVAQARGWRRARHPAIALPVNLFGEERRNSSGFDMADATQLSQLKADMARFWRQRNANTPPGAIAVRNPANTDEIVGYHNRYATAEDMERQVAAADAAFAPWSRTPVNERAKVLNEFADALEQQRNALIALCVKEAGKTIDDALAEVREAADFCRYYARQAQLLFAERQYRPRGIMLCISPWNFPLAIFTGQVCAALVAGNTVVAKPAEQTALIAQYAQTLLRKCGLPEAALEVIVSPGAPVGEQLLEDARVCGVMFTGSTATAHAIQQYLARRPDAPLPLVAETGGQNAMIVDSTALPEQVVDDVVRSAFHSAGQRCSSLRVLFLQQEIAPKVIDMLKGAMDELVIGDPAHLATDVGPVIDRRALARLDKHVEYMHDHGKLLHSCTLPQSTASGHFFAPRLYEIADMRVLPGEVFGPVVHVIRYCAADLDAVIDQINASGYGLTLGVHSRVQRTAERVARRAQVGNVYVNRDMVGAVVGVQPFGGRGLSGTGPKAGGPHYLYSLVRPAPVVQPALPPIAASEPAEIDTGWLFGLQRELPAWNDMPVSARAPVLGQTLLRLERDGVIDAAVAKGCRRALDAAITELAQPRQLPGPTGEDNRLLLEPRGVVLSVLADAACLDRWLVQVVTALIAGNTVAVLAHRPAYHLVQACSSTFADCSDVAALNVIDFEASTTLSPFFKHPIVAAVMMADRGTQRQWAAQHLAEREGPILPLLCEEDAQQLLLRLVVEKVITVNTTAAGGNASLMSLAGELA